MAYLIHYNDERSYLIHYNKNHSKSNGQFVSGDGDGDGIVNDHANKKKSSNGKTAMQKAEQTMKVGRGLRNASWGLTAASIGLSLVGKKGTNIASGVTAIADISMFAIGMGLEQKGRNEVNKLLSKGVK